MLCLFLGLSLHESSSLKCFTDFEFLEFFMLLQRAVLTIELMKHHLLLPLRFFAFLSEKRAAFIGETSFFLLGGNGLQCLKIWTSNRLIGNTTKRLLIPIETCSHEKLTGPSLTSVYRPTSVWYHIAFAIMVHKRSDKQIAGHV